MFAADDLVHGLELWITDGTETGTKLLKDINQGPEGSSIDSLTTVGAYVYFYATHDGNNYSLWRTDGTEAGTIDLEASPYKPHQRTVELLAVDNELFFAAADPRGGLAIWHSDGSVDGTKIWRAPDELNDFGSTELVGHTTTHIFFSEGTGSQDNLWSIRKDNQLVTDLDTGGIDRRYVTSIGNTLYFPSSFDTTGGSELWKSNGTTNGTSIVKDINPDGSSSPSYLTVFKNKVYFNAEQPGTGRELWVSDGSGTGTKLVKDLSVRQGFGYDGDPRLATIFENRLYFQAAYTASPTDYPEEILWSTDGTTAGTAPVRSNGETYQVHWTDVDNIVTTPLGLAFVSNNGFISAIHLIQSGTTTPSLVQRGDNSASIGNLGYIANKLNFKDPNQGIGAAIWSNSGTLDSTELVKDIANNDADSAVQEFDRNRDRYQNSNRLKQFAIVGNKAYFAARSGENTTELWETDGTTENTRQITFINPNRHAVKHHPVNLNGILYYTAEDTDNVTYLWRYNPATETNEALRFFTNPNRLTAFQDSLVLVATGPREFNYGEGIWRFRPDSNGFSVIQVSDDASQRTSDTSKFHVTDNKLYFAGKDPDTGILEVWINDGPSTRLIRDPATTEPFINPHSFLTVGEDLFFIANHNRELWYTDGTATNTKRLIKAATGFHPHYLVPGSLSYRNNAIYFGINKYVLLTNFSHWQIGKIADPENSESESGYETEYFNNVFYRPLAGLIALDNKLIALTEFGSYAVDIDSTPQTAQLLNDKPSTPIEGYEGGDGGLAFFKIENQLAVTNGSPIGTRVIQDIFPGSRNDANSNNITLMPEAGVGLLWAEDLRGEEPRVFRIRDILSVDYGDAPDPNYPSTYASDGARHRVTDLRLGTALDHESDALLDINNSATGDDLDNDDEDGVSFGDLAISANADITVVSSAGGALLDAWIDFNRDGDWDDSGEQIFASQALVAGDNELSVAIPTTVTSDGNSSTVTPGASFARFRISSEGGLATTGEARDGEVEDYAVTILPPPNAKPTITTIADQQTDEDTAFSVSFTIADEEDDVSDLSLTYEFGTGDVVDNSSIGTLTVGNGGLRTLEISPLADKNGNQTITIKVTDTDSGFASTSFNLTVLPVNDKPVINDQNSLTTPEEQALTLALADFSTTDVDGDTLSLSVGTGSNYSVDGLTITPHVNFVGSLTVPVTVNDGQLDSETFNASVTVTNVNDAPTIAARSTLRTDEDTTLELLLAHFNTNDVDGDSLTLQVGSGSNYSFSGTTITPAQDFSGTLTVPVTVNDGTVDSTVHNASVTVRPVNDAPTISGQQALNTDEDTALTLKLEDFNTNDVENQILTLIVMTGTNYSVNGLSITPAQDFNGTLSVPVKVRDIQGAESETFAARISVNAVNDKPLITGQKALSVNEDSSITLTLTDFTTSDVDGDSLTLKLLAGDGYSHSGLTVTPAADFNGKLSVNVVVNDGELDSETFAAEVTVTAVNDKPTVTAQAEPLSTNEDTALTLKLEDFTTNDIDNDPLTLKVQRGSNYSVSGLTITPANNFNGTLTVPVVVNDGQLDSAPFNASVTVTAVNDAPVINGQRPLSTNNQTPITLKRQHFDISDPDSDSDSELFQLTVGLGENYALEGNRVIPDSAFVGSLAVPVFVIDDLGELSEVFTSEVEVLDSSSPHLSLTSNRQSAAEGQLIRLTAWLSQATDDAVAVSLSLTERSQAGADDITLPRQITLAPGSTQASVDIAVRDDGNAEGHEHLEINPAVTAGSVTSALSLLTLTLHDANLVTHNNEPTAVDGDDDGNNDAEQSQVYSSTFVHRVTGNSNTTTAVSVFIPEADRHNGVVIDNAQIGDIDELMQPTQSSDSDFAANAISFDLRGLNPGGCADVHMLLGPVNSTPAYDRYYKLQYNARTGTQELLLFDYDEASQTGARFDTTVVNGVEQRRVTLSLCDGERGDYDNVANGIIEDPGVPAAAKASSTSTSTRPYGGGGSVSWHALFILALVLAVRRRWHEALHRSR